MTNHKPLTLLQVLPESENREEVEVLFQSGLEQYKESQSKPDETEPVPSTVSIEVFDNYGYHGYHGYHLCMLVTLVTMTS